MTDHFKASSATARVQILLEIPVGGSWEGTCSLDQIYRQAGREAANAVENALHDRFGQSIRILNTKVTAVSAVSEDFR